VIVIDDGSSRNRRPSVLPVAAATPARLTLSCENEVSRGTGINAR